MGRGSYGRGALVCWWALCSLALAGCGYVGEPQYPALNITGRIVDLAAVERGDHLTVAFTIPPLTTEGLPVRFIGAVDLRVGPPNPGPFSPDRWAEGATRVEVKAPEKPGSMSFSVSIAKFIGTDVIVGVRIANARGRFSEWSNFAALTIQTPLSRPVLSAPENVTQGVALKWSAPGQSNFRVFRSSAKEPRPALLATTSEAAYLDATTVYGVRYEYFVQGFKDTAESEMAGPVAITPKDEFAPAVPSGLTATAGIDAIELAWERNTEPDFKGYRVYRWLAGAAFERIADLIEAPNFSDRKIEAGKRYSYVVTSVDQSGNESARTAPVEVTAP